MEFTVANSLQYFGGNLHPQAFNVYSSTSHPNLTNPGLNLQLYTDIVPINGGHNTTEYKIEQKVNSLSTTDVAKQDNPVQEGAGMTQEALIEKSFRNPIKIETITIEKNEKGRKRHHKSERKDNIEPKKSKHKFQFV
ncbi:MAG: hypothetical protein FJ333_02230 [Sphingomonadales bacterium]|nr:hypothetical protein [Sphingomonadales bacterium]